MIQQIQNYIVGLALLTLAALEIGLLFALAWRQLTRRLSRAGLMAFLIFAGIATVEAQKHAGTIVVDAAGEGDFTDLNSAINAIPSLELLPCEIIVRPGVYGPVLIDGEKFKTDYLTWAIDIRSTDGAYTAIIDGNGADYGFGFTYDKPIPHPTVSLDGITVRNADIGLYDVSVRNCIVRDCRIGAYNACIDQSVVFNNHECGIMIWDFDKYAPDFPWRGNFENWYWAENCAVVSNGVGISGLVSGPMNVLFHGNGTDCIDSGEPYGCYFGDDPMFVDMANSDFHLRMGSPCINTGVGWWGSADTDFDGNPRFQRGANDVGPYEFQPTNDTQTITAPVPVEFSWIDEKCPDLLASVGGDYDKAVLLKSANPVDIGLPEPLRSYYSIWESYVADLDPTKSNMTFRATIDIVDGGPVVNPDPFSPRRSYTVLGKENLTNAEWRVANPESRFFKVKVSLP